MSENINLITGQGCDFFPVGSVHADKAKIHNFCLTQLIEPEPTKQCPKCHCNFILTAPFVNDAQPGSVDMCTRCYGKYKVPNHIEYVEAIKKEVLMELKEKG